MSKTDVINATLLSAGIAFIGEGVNLIQSNLLYAILAVVVGVGIIAVREVLP